MGFLWIGNPHYDYPLKLPLYDIELNEFSVPLSNTTLFAQNFLYTSLHLLIENMGYTKDDELAINTIRLLAVSSPVFLLCYFSSICPLRQPNAGQCAL